MKHKKTKNKKNTSFEDSVYSPKRNINSHIDFRREGKKTNARKVMTEVRCIECEKLFSLPFKPRKPEIYCNECYKNKKIK